MIYQDRKTVFFCRFFSDGQFYSRLLPAMKGWPKKIGFSEAPRTHLEMSWGNFHQNKVFLKIHNGTCLYVVHFIFCFRCICRACNLNETHGTNSFLISIYFYESLCLDRWIADDISCINWVCLKLLYWYPHIQCFSIVSPSLYIWKWNRWYTLFSDTPNYHTVGDIPHPISSIPIVYPCIDC